MTEPMAVENAVIETLRGVSTATITTQLFKRGLRNQFVQGVLALNPNACRFVGEATTLRSIPAREDIDQIAAFQDPGHPQRQAIERVGPGQVLVLDCRGDTRAANGGGILVARAMRRGAEAIVSDGAFRDSGEIARMSMPVFCAGRSAPLSLAVHHAVDIDVPIACGGVAVFPGDILVGDEDGVVVIPRHLAGEIAGPAAEQELLERFIGERIDGGAALPGTYPPNEATLDEYAAWRSVRAVEPDDEI